MKIVKRTLLGTGIFILIILQIGLFLPHEFRYQRAVWIDAPPQTIFPLIKNLERWEQWTVWNPRNDPTYKSTVLGAKEGEGAFKTWESKKVGNGTLEIILEIENRIVTYDKTLEEDGFRTNGKIELIEKDGGTEVLWAEEGDFGYNLIGRYLGLLMDTFFGKDLQKSLLNLKNICESNGATKL